MMAQDREVEKRQLSRLRSLRDELEGYSWLVEPDAGETHLVAVRRDGEAELIATIHSGASPDELSLLRGSIDNLRFLLALIERASARILAMQAAAEPPADRKPDNTMALSAKGLCAQTRFWRFLEDRSVGGDIGSAAEADARLKYHLDFKSKADLNKTGPLRDAFERLRADYRLWAKGEL